MHLSWHYLSDLVMWLCWAFAFDVSLMSGSVDLDGGGGGGGGVSI